MVSKLFYRIITALLIFLLIVFIGIIIAGGYFGFVPGLNVLFGSNHPRDLGIRFASEDTLTVQRKVGVRLVGLPKETPVTASIKWSGETTVSYSLTSEELSALVNNRPWVYYPFKDLQVRITEEPTPVGPIVEAAGLIDTSKVFSFLEALGSDPSKLRNQWRRIPIKLRHIPFYIKGSSSISEGIIDLAIYQVEIGRFPVPQELVARSQGIALDFLRELFLKIPGLNINRLEFSDGMLIFDGTLPEEEATVND
jgi:hypothetical protein